MYRIGQFETNHPQGQPRKSTVLFPYRQAEGGGRPCQNRERKPVWNWPPKTKKAERKPSGIGTRSGTRRKWGCAVYGAPGGAPVPQARLRGCGPAEFRPLGPERAPPPGVEAKVPSPRVPAPGDTFPAAGVYSPGFLYKVRKMSYTVKKIMEDHYGTSQCLDHLLPGAGSRAHA